MTMLKRSIYTMLPSLAFLTFKSKGGGGGSTTTIDPKVRDRIMMPAYKAAERAAGATYNEADGTYSFEDYEGYDGQRLTDWNQYHRDANAMLPGALSAGDSQFANALTNADNFAQYGGPSNVDWKFLGETDSVTGPIADFQTMTAPTADFQTMRAANVYDPDKVDYVDANAAKLIAPRDATATTFGAPSMTAAQIDRNAIQNVNNAGVTGAAVAADAFGSLQPQARSSIRDVGGVGFMGSGLNKYMNPYRSQVIDTTMEALDRQRQIQQQQNAASATQAGAFGGSRQGVLEAETNRGFADQAAQTMAALNAQGFDTAASLQQADADRALQAQLSNQQMDQASTQQALNLSGQFGLANQDASLRAALANQGVDSSTLQFNAGNTQQANMQNAANQLATSQSNQQAQLQAALANQQTDLNRYGQDAQFAQQAGLQNANMNLAAGTTNQASEMQRKLANQAAQMETYKSNQASYNQNALANQAAMMDSYQSNQGAYNQAALANQEANLQAMLANQSTALARGQSNQDAALEASLANAQYGLQGQQLAMSGNEQLSGLASQATDRELGGMDTYLNAADMVQGMDQSKLDLEYQKWMDEQNHEINQANILQGAASGYPAGSTTSGGGGKIICTMMNESYGFGHFRNQIWLEQSANLDPAIERGYHKIFLPVVAFAKGDSWLSRMARKIMEHGARHRTADIWKQKRGKRDRIGQAYRLIFEPICYVVGKVVK